ncbi:MAG: ATP-grasp domain-containing protein [Myxococcota bacterium]
MPGRVVILLGPQTDPHLVHLADALAARGVDHRRIDSRGSATALGLRYAPETGAGTLGNVDLDDIGGVFVKALPPRNPLLPIASGASFSPDDVRVAEAEGGALRDTLCAVLVELAARSIPVLNVPPRGVAEQQKPYQLAVARRAGLSVPRTLLSCDPEEAAAFIDTLDQESARCIAKPVRGGSFASFVSANDVRLASLVRAPVILQRYIEGEELRVYVHDGEVLGAARISGTDAADHRSDPVYRSGAACYTKERLAADVQLKLFALLSALELRFAAVDLRVEAKTGVHWFLEANAAPAFLEFESRTGYPITDTLATVLGNQALSNRDA